MKSYDDIFAIKKDGKESILEYATGSIVVLLKRFYQDGTEDIHLGGCSYHLHFLVLTLKKDKELFIKCLDNSDFISSKAMGLDFEDRNKTKNEMLKELVKSWVDKEMDYYQDDVDLSNIVKHSAPKEYWDKFNDIKKSSYCKKIKSFFDYVSEQKTKKLRSNIKEETHDGTNILMERIKDKVNIQAIENEYHFV